MICFSLLSSRSRGPSRVIKITTLGVFQTVCLIWSLFFEVMFMSFFFVVGPRVNMVAAAAS